MHGSLPSVTVVLASAVLAINPTSAQQASEGIKLPSGQILLQPMKEL
jgi:hypothetical protein